MLRAATITDANLVAMMVLHELERRQIRALRRVTKEQLSQVCFKGYHDPQFRYGYAQARVYETQGASAAVAFGYPAAAEPDLDHAWEPLLRSIQVFPKNQTFTLARAWPDEWYLDMLLVRPRYRYKTYQQIGFDEWLMRDVRQRALASGHRVVGMDVRPGTQVATLAATFGFVVTERRRFDRHPYVHLRWQLV